MPSFKLGFLDKAKELGDDIVGQPVTEQDYLKLAEGEEIAFQTTSKGFMYYSKRGNLVHFVPAIASPALWRPGVHYFTDQPAGQFTSTPKGVILHGSRSGVQRCVEEEFFGTANWALKNPDGLGWNATIGPHAIALHLTPKDWGWNARQASSKYLAVEFSQPLLNGEIDDRQVRAFAWWFVSIARKEWPALPSNFPTHWELDGTAEYGSRDGKTDPFDNLTRTLDLRQRILAHVSYFQNHRG